MFYYTIKPFKFQKVVYNENIFEIVDSFILFEGAGYGSKFTYDCFTGDRGDDCREWREREFG
ncbi:hypothetical protein HpHCM55_06590 [Helicobacter pylori]